MLVEHLLGHIRTLKDQCTILSLSTPTVNVPAIRFYSRMGFALGKTFVVNGNTHPALCSVLANVRDRVRALAFLVILGIVFLVSYPRFADIC